MTEWTRTHKAVGRARRKALARARTVATAAMAAMAALALLGAVAGAARAQDAVAPGATLLQRGGSFTEPPARVEPIYLPQGPNRYPQVGGETVMQLRLTADFPLRRKGTTRGQGTQGPQPASPTVQAQLRWTPWPGTGWFAQANALRYLQSGEQRPWDPDFTYAFGWDDGQPGRWALTYANYTGTRLRPGSGEDRLNFAQGQWTLARRFRLPTALESLLLVGDGDAALCSIDGHLVRRYTRADGGPLGRDKTSLALGCRYTRPDGWFAHATAFAWPGGGARQQPWDPDYTWGVGWTPPGWDSLTFQYANYSGNRWPGRTPGLGEGGLRGGSVSISWATAW